jgi:hypothetical protein
MHTARFVQTPTPSPEPLENTWRQVSPIGGKICLLPPDRSTGTRADGGR